MNIYKESFCYFCVIYLKKRTQNLQNQEDFFFLLSQTSNYIYIVTAVYVHGLVKELHRSILPKVAILTVRIDLFEVITALCSNCN